jgi:hypothetical protein
MPNQLSKMANWSIFLAKRIKDMPGLGSRCMTKKSSGYCIVDPTDIPKETFQFSFDDLCSLGLPACLPDGISQTVRTKWAYKSGVLKGRMVRVAVLSSQRDRDLAIVGCVDGHDHKLYCKTTWRPMFCLYCCETLSPEHLLYNPLISELVDVSTVSIYYFCSSFVDIQ